MNGQIKYYPTGNGDQSLISVTEKDPTTQEDYTTNIIIDCNIRESCKGDSDKSQCDVKADVLKTLFKRNGMPYVDVFILTHGDQDHCRGFEANFYQGDPRKYGDKHKKAEEIFIDVLWFSPMVLEESGNSDAECYRKEALRRIKLHNDDHADKDLPGNKIIIVGYNGNENISDLNTRRVVPGKIVTKFNERELTTFSIFIHAPYKVQLANGKALAPDYTTSAIDTAIASRQRPAKHKQRQAKPHLDTRYSANVPQVLSAVLHTTPANPDHFGHDQSLGHRHKR